MHGRGSAERDELAHKIEFISVNCKEWPAAQTTVIVGAEQAQGREV